MSATQIDKEKYDELLRFHIRSKDLSKDEKLKQIQLDLAYGADPNAYFKEAFYDQKDPEVARVLLENSDFDIKNHIKPLQDIVESVLQDLTDRDLKDATSASLYNNLSIIFDLQMLGVPLTQDATNIINAMLIDYMKTKEFDKLRWLRVFLEAGYIPSLEVFEEALKYDNTKELIIRFPGIRYDTLDKEFKTYLENIANSKLNDLHNKCIFWSKKFKYLEDVYKNEWPDIIGRSSVSEDDIKNTKSRYGDFTEMDKNLREKIPLITERCETLANNCSKLWQKIKEDPINKDINVFNRRVYDLWSQNPNKTAVEQAFMTENKENIENCVDAELFIKDVSPEEKARETSKTVEYEHLMRESGAKPSHWHDSKIIPSIAEIFPENVEADYRFKDFVRKGKILSISGEYHRDKNNDESKVAISGAIQGDEALSEFIGLYFPQIGIASLAKLVRDPLRDFISDKGQWMIKQKCYQYLDIMDIMAYNNKNTGSAQMGLVLHAKYNNVVMMINFGMDMLLVTNDPAFKFPNKDGKRKYSLKLSNGYSFGKYTIQDGVLMKSGPMLMFNPESSNNEYDLGTDQIVAFTDLDVNVEYMVVIAPQGTFDSITGDTYISPSEVLNIPTIKDIKEVATVHLHPTRHRIDEIQARREKIERNIENINRYKTDYTERTKVGCKDVSRKACLHELSTEQFASLHATKGPLVTIYGASDNRRDSPTDNTITKQFVMHEIPEKVGMFQSFTFRDDTDLPGFDSLNVGQIITFTNRNDAGITFAYFLKVKSTENDRSILVELKQLSREFKNKKVMLSFPDYKKTFKIDAGALSEENVSCYNLTGDTDIQILKLVNDYKELTDAYIGLVTNSRTVSSIDLANDTINEIADTLKQTAGVKNLAEILNSTNETPEQVINNINAENIETLCASFTTQLTCENPENQGKCKWTTPDGPCVVHDRPLKLTDEDLKRLDDQTGASVGLKKNQYSFLLKFLMVLAVTVPTTYVTSTALRYFTGKGLGDYVMQGLKWAYDFSQAEEQLIDNSTATVFNATNSATASGIPLTVEQTKILSDNVFGALLNSSPEALKDAASLAEGSWCPLAEIVQNGMKVLTNATIPLIDGAPLANPTQSAQVQTLLETITGVGTVVFSNLTNTQVELMKTLATVLGAGTSGTLNIPTSKGIFRVPAEMFVRLITNRQGELIPKLPELVSGVCTAAQEMGKCAVSIPKVIGSNATSIGVEVCREPIRAFTETLTKVATETNNDWWIWLALKTGFESKYVVAFGLAMVTTGGAAAAAYAAGYLTFGGVAGAAAGAALRSRVGIMALEAMYQAADPATRTQLAQQIITHSATALRETVRQRLGI